MRLLVTRDPKNELAKAFSSLANPVRKRTLKLAFASLNPAELSVILYVADLSGLPPDALVSVKSFPMCRVILASSATIDHGDDFVRWLHAGAADVLLPGKEDQLKQRVQWAVDGLAEPDPGTLTPFPAAGSVYLVTPYRNRHLETMERWVKPALHYAGYQGVLIQDVHGPSIRYAENHMAQACSFAVAHLGNDDKPDAKYNPRIHSEIRTLVNNGKLVIGIRHSSEAHIELPGDFQEINCHHFDSDPDVARWFYKILTKAKPNEASAATNS